MPKWLIDPTFERIDSYVSGELDGDTDPVMIAARERRAEEASKVDATKGD
jgi:hypothetical protein